MLAVTDEILLWESGMAKLKLFTSTYSWKFTGAGVTRDGRLRDPLVHSATLPLHLVAQLEHNGVGSLPLSSPACPGPQHHHCAAGLCGGFGWQRACITVIVFKYDSLEPQ